MKICTWIIYSLSPEDGPQSCFHKQELQNKKISHDLIFILNKKNYISNRMSFSFSWSKKDEENFKTGFDFSFSF